MVIAFSKREVEAWIECVHKVSKAAAKPPQAGKAPPQAGKAPQAAKAPQAGKAAFASLTKSLLCEWEFIQRVVPDSGYALIPLDEAIMKCFFLTLLSGNITEAECIAVNNLQSKK